MSATYINSWYKHAAVRRQSRIMFNADSQLPLFPEELQPVCNHPLVLALSTAAKDQLLLQFCYKFLQEVCITENDVVNPTSLNIANGLSPVVLDETVKVDAFSIIADEAFHSYVARDFLLQVQQFTGILPMVVPNENEATKAMENVKKRLPREYHLGFELIATCISENIFTDEIINVSRLNQVNESFHQVMVDHAKDEGRHANYFVKVMSAYWSQINDSTKNFFAKIIPEFIDFCLDGKHDREYALKLLNNIGMSDKNIEICLNENINQTLKDSTAVRLKNILKFFKRSGVISFEPLTNALDERYAVHL